MRTARESARKLKPRALLRVGASTLTTGLLFHPLSNALLVADGRDGVSVWDPLKGACGGRWATSTGGAGVAGGAGVGGGGGGGARASLLWDPAFTHLLRRRLLEASALPSGTPPTGSRAAVLGGSFAAAAAAAAGRGGKGGGAGGIALSRGALARATRGSASAMGNYATVSGGSGSAGAPRRGLPLSFNLKPTGGVGGAGRPGHTAGAAAADAPATAPLRAGDRSEALAALSALRAEDDEGEWCRRASEPEHRDWRRSSGGSGAAAAGGGVPGGGGGGGGGGGPGAGGADGAWTAPCVTSMCWVDEHDSCHLLTGGADGGARLWRGGDVADVFTHAGECGEGADDGGEGGEGAGGGSGGGAPRRRSSASSWGFDHGGGGGGAGGGGARREDVWCAGGAGGGATRRPALVTSWCAMPELCHPAVCGGGGEGGGRGAAAGAPSSPPLGGAAGAAGGGEDAGAASSGLLLHWLPASCTLLAAGGAPYARLWDMGTQRASGLLHLPGGGGGGNITCLSSAWPGDSIVVAGTSSGALHVLDTRLASGAGSSAAGAASAARSAAVLTLREHSKYVVAVSHARSQSAFSLVSGSVAADVRSWDLRVPRCVTALLAHSRGFMTAFAQHDYAPLWATGSSGQQARVFTNAGEPLADVRFHDGFVGQRIGQVSALAWHPHKLMLAIGAADSFVDILAGP